MTVELVKQREFKIGYNQANVTTEVVEYLEREVPKEGRTYVLLCIGTDRSTGDSFGPIIGTMMKKEHNGIFEVEGTLEEPVHALNLSERVESVYKKYENPYILAIDAALGRYENVGKLDIGQGGIEPGTGVGKDLGIVGDLYIKGIVNISLGSSFGAHEVLGSTRLHLVYDMAQRVVEILNEFGERLKQGEVTQLNKEN